MRTTLDIDDDILEAVKELGKRQRKTAGSMLSSLARQALTTTTSGPSMTREPEEFYGFRPLPKEPGRIVTNAMVDRIREEDPE